ncbi:MAG: outer membrane beta-barrel protein [Bacteriovoracaceae bacterium]
MKSKKLVYALMFGLALNSLSILAVIANDFGDEEVLNSEQIDIDGSIKRNSEADKIRRERQNLEKDNEDLVRKKIEDMRIAEEKKMSDRLKNMLGGQGSLQQDTVSTQAASVIEAKKEEPVKPVGADNRFQVKPFYGITHYKGDNVNFESKINTGLGFDAKLNDRFSIGLGLKYVNMSIQQIDRSPYMNSYYNNGYYTGGYGYNYNYNYNLNYSNNWYQNTFQNQREIEMNQFGFELTGKFFILPDSRVRPYAGLGLGYSKTQLNYKSLGGSSSAYYNPYSNVQYGDEGYNASTFSGIVLLGADFYFTERFGLNAEMRYAKGFASDYNQDLNNTLIANPDQRFLQLLGSDIDNAHSASIMLGILFGF